MKRSVCQSLKSVLFCIPVLFSAAAHAWDYEGHRWVNQLALASLPTNFPSFVRDAKVQERIAFLAGEPDRWRNTSDLTLKHFNAPDHYIDIDDLPDYGLTTESLSPFRYEFTAQLALARAKHPEKFAAIDPAQNTDHTRELVGFLPWTITEYYGKLKSAFSYLKTFEENGTPEEIENAQQNVAYVMGVMGHFVGDAAQPLHTTKHFNGWVGANPKNYPTHKTFHSWIDGGFIKKTGLELSEIQPRIKTAAALPALNANTKHPDVFPSVIAYINEQHTLVEPIYELEKNHQISVPGDSAKGREFIKTQLAKGGQMLGNLWYSAWQQAEADTYLKARLLDRKANGKPAPAKK